MAKKTQDRFNLHDALASGSYDHAVICTYTFEPVFFEEYCLEKFGALHNNANITMIVDQRQYEQAILAPEAQRPRLANLRYLLHPVSVPGVFHPKLILLASRRRGKLILGSANFTLPGITRNAELVGCYEYEEGKSEGTLPLFQAAWSFIAGASRRWAGNALDSNLGALIRDAAWLGSTNGKASQLGYALLNNLESPLWRQLTVKVNAAVKTVYILSRYFDAQPTLLERVHQDLQPRKIKIFTQNRITTMTREWLKHPLVKEGVAEIFLCTYGDGEYSQPLHGKAIILDTGQRCVFAYGSANFTSAALLTTAAMGNAELLVVFDGLATKDCQPQRICDPNDNAELLDNEAILFIAPKEDKDDALPDSSAYRITLLEATLDGERLSVRAEVSEEVAYDHLLAKVTFRDNTQTSVTLHPGGQSAYAARLSEAIAQRLGKSSSTLTLEAFTGDVRVADSNCILITNLLDIKTGQNVTRQRHIREAEQSADQFFSVLRDLSNGSDDDALKDFLSYCNIPFTSASQALFARGLVTQWDADAGMRMLGENNLKVFDYLHDAALDFVDRHYRRLKRHTKQRDLAGVANFLHIFRAIGGVLHNQALRLVNGLEAKQAPLTSDEWAKCREHFDTYYSCFKQLMDCLWDEYASMLFKEYDAEAVQEGFEPDLEAIHTLCAEMLAFPDRIETLRVSRLRIFGRKEPPVYFHCIFSESRWPRFAREVNSQIASVETAVIGQ